MRALFRFARTLKGRNQTFPKSTTRVQIPSAPSGEIKRTGFTPGEEAPIAYNEKFVYPKDWEPWKFNYKGNGMLIGSQIILWLAYFFYEYQYLSRTGRTRRPERIYYHI